MDNKKCKACRAELIGAEKKGNVCNRCLDKRAEETRGKSAS